MCHKLCVNFQEQKHKDNFMVAELVVLWQQGEREVLEDAEKAELRHIVGYLARQAIKEHKCQACINLLLDMDYEARLQPVCLHATEHEVDLLEEDVHRSFTKLLDRGPALLKGGGLLTPSYIAIKTTDEICQLYRWLMKDQVSFFFIYLGSYCLSKLSKLCSDFIYLFPLHFSFVLFT